jgi:hypothetical protein
MRQGRSDSLPPCLVQTLSSVNHAPKSKASACHSQAGRRASPDLRLPRQVLKLGSHTTSSSSTDPRHPPGPVQIKCLRLYGVDVATSVPAYTLFVFELGVEVLNRHLECSRSIKCSVSRFVDADKAAPYRSRVSVALRCRLSCDTVALVNNGNEMTWLDP